MIYFHLLSMSVPARSEYNPEFFKGIAGPQPVSVNSVPSTYESQE